MILELFGRFVSVIESDILFPLQYMIWKYVIDSVYIYSVLEEVNLHVSLLTCNL